MTTWLKRLETWPKQIVALICVWFVTLVGLVDYVTGYETFFFTYYLLAIFFATWQVGGKFGVLISALSVTAWISANIAAGARYSSYFVPVWNAAIMFTIYLIVVWLLITLKKIYAELEERVRHRTAALTHEIQERVRLQKEVLETSDREQRRISRELHDGLCQHLTGTAMAGHLLGQKLAGRSQAEAAEAARLVHLVEEAIEMTRELSQQLDPVELEAAQLPDRLADLAANIRARFKISCAVEHHLTQPLNDATVATHLFRIAQQAVAGAVKPGGASHINIELDSTADEIVLTVTDDGAGRTENVSDDANAGWRAMAYRAELMGAAFHVERLGAKGTRVTCVLPFPGKQQYVAKN